MGSNKMLQVALGKTEADEYRANLSRLSARLRGHVGLFFTSLPREEARRGPWQALRGLRGAWGGRSGVGRGRRRGAGGGGLGPRAGAGRAGGTRCLAEAVRTERKRARVAPQACTRPAPARPALPPRNAPPPPPRSRACLASLSTRTMLAPAASRPRTFRCRPARCRARAAARCRTRWSRSCASTACRRGSTRAWWSCSPTTRWVGGGGRAAAAAAFGRPSAPRSRLDRARRGPAAPLPAWPAAAGSAGVHPRRRRARWPPAKRPPRPPRATRPTRHAPRAPAGLPRRQAARPQPGRAAARL
jgi:hypothetical protein